jgi:hypothetical protein
MQKRGFWVAGAAAMAAFVGCASTPPPAADTQVALLPATSKAELVDAQQKVAMAESNVTSARVAVDEARQYRDIARSEMDASQARLRAAEQAVALYERARDPRITEAQRAAGVAREQLLADRSKLDYAERLVDVRQAKLREMEATRDVARADVELARVRALRQNAMATTVDEARAFDNLQLTQTRLASARRDVATAQGSAEYARSLWRQQKTRADVASARGVPGELPPPAPPERLPSP